MRDYVNCPFCGLTIDSDFAVSREIQGHLLFFCNETHAAMFNKEAM